MAETVKFPEFPARLTLPVVGCRGNEGSSNVSIAQSTCSLRR
jgi:hypothetical protein